MGALGRLSESTGCNQERKVSKVIMGKEVFEEPIEKLSHGVKSNPIIWNLDADYLKSRDMSIETFNKILQEDHGLNGFVLEKAIEYKMGYPQWSEK